MESPFVVIEYTYPFITLSNIACTLAIARESINCPCLMFENKIIKWMKSNENIGAIVRPANSSPIYLLCGCQPAINLQTI